MTAPEPVHLEVHGNVRVLRMEAGENRFNRTFVDAWYDVVDRLEAVQGPCALVTTGSGKFFSNGLDLEWLATGQDTHGFLDDVYSLFDRVLTLGMYTVAAVNGHAFAVGAMLASAHDRIIMRADRGYWCLPEVDLGLPLTPEMYTTLAAHVPPPTLAEAALTGRRYTAQEALQAGIAQETVAEDQLLARALEIASPLAVKDRAVVAAHKRLLYGGAHSILSPYRLRPHFHLVDSNSPGARRALGQYFDELAARFTEGFDADAAMSDAAQAYAPPRGLFVIAGSRENPDACGALCFLDGETAEIKRMWVSPAERGKGLATALLRYLEDLSRESGRMTVVLDTNSALTEAIALYERSGYVPAERYSDNPYAHRWFRKTLAERHSE